MSLTAAVELALLAAGVYCGLGAAFALAFQLGGLTRVDPQARGAGIFFRVLITPGVIALWPLLAARWRAAAAGRPRAGAVHRPAAATLRAVHRRSALVLALLVPAGAGLGLALRPPAVTGHLAAGPLPDPAPRGVEVLADAEPFAGLPLRLHVRCAGPAAQIELELDRDLDAPSLLLYWSEDAATFSRTGVLLGHVWGPGRRRFDLPARAAGGGGSLVLFAPLAAQTVGVLPAARMPRCP